MDLKAYITPLLRWWWLLIVATLVAATSSYFAVRNQPPIYQATTTLMIGHMIEELNPNSSDFYLVQQLAATYADIGNRDPIKYATMQSLGISRMPSTSTQALPNTALIQIAVTDTDPKLAQDVANEMARQLILQSPSGTSAQDASRQQFVNEQLDKLQTQIQDTSDEIDSLQQQLGDLTGARQIADMQTQISAQQDKLSSLQANYASLLQSTQQGATNTLSVIEAASLPVSPIAPNKMMTIALASAIGLVLAGLAAYGMEAIDDTIKTADEISRLVNAPVLGDIGEFPKKSNKLTYVMEEARSPIADAFRKLRTNLSFLGVDNPMKVILVTSLETGEGKSIVAANLAASLAQSEKKVVLVDADLHKPTIHQIFGDQNENGLSELCLGSITGPTALRPWGNNGHLNVIPSGVLPPNPAELLGSNRMRQIIESLKKNSDIIILDCPPLFITDTLELSKIADGLLLVVYPKHTQKKSVKRMLAQIHLTGAKIVGIVMNHSRMNETFYANYYYKKAANRAKPAFHGLATKKKDSNKDSQE